MRPRRRSEWKVEEGSHTESSDGETNEARPEAVSPIRLDLPARSLILTRASLNRRPNIPATDRRSSLRPLGFRSSGESQIYSESTQILLRTVHRYPRSLFMVIPRLIPTAEHFHCEIPGVAITFLRPSLLARRSLSRLLSGRLLLKSISGTFTVGTSGPVSNILDWK